MGWLEKHLPSLEEATSTTPQLHENTSSNRFNVSHPLPSAPPAMQPRPYHNSLTPLLSPLRPHCLARDRLRLWVPATSRSRLDHTGSLVSLTDSNIDRILLVIAHCHAPSTRECYGSSLLVFHVFCDSRGIPEHQRCPASSVLVLAFLAGCAGLYSGKTLENYFYGIHAWHLLHDLPWSVDQAQASLTLEGAKSLAPSSSSRAKRAPFTVALLLMIHSSLDLSTPLHAAVYACLTTSFFTIARTGEFTVPSLKSFDRHLHVSVSDIRHKVDRHGFHVTVFRLPRTNTSSSGEDVYWAAQSGLADPLAALNNHLHINHLSPSDALFSWQHGTGLHALTRTAFLKCLKDASAHSGHGDLKGHGIRIGGTLEYLLRGVPFETMKTMGRWNSDAFVLYLQKHTIVLAPYLQDQPVLEPFMCYALPT
ncbi:uncharacterized protein F5891DRAFT_963498 [Suillus fuscotomentosus]|uniref:Uncharacterized protein n=1 Tax=Suillus fuscotomentosus TaxID=1912939 RepID=A0AAD4DSN9_9AGAM|nr:uncharacterized protein F5891DRAFT_963498 [Suillus fuscotomentosus]KAG1893102.1 hypothetical protein F5891DRAFT_963498 [Suillus fuscotomentosus]